MLVLYWSAGIMETVCFKFVFTHFLPTTNETIRSMDFYCTIVIDNLKNLYIYQSCKF